MYITAKRYRIYKVSAESYVAQAVHHRADPRVRPQLCERGGREPRKVAPNAQRVLVLAIWYESVTEARAEASAHALLGHGAKL